MVYGLRKCLAMAACLTLVPISTAWAVYPEIEGFENDNDVEQGALADYVPGEDPFYRDMVEQDDTIDVSHPMGYDVNLSIHAAWRERRSQTGPSGAGIIEEVPDGWADIAPSAGDNFGVIIPESGDGPSGKPSFQVAKLNHDWSFQTDVYTDPAYIPTQGIGGGGHENGSNGVPDFWWTSAVNNGDGGTAPPIPGFPPPPAGYLTESGLTGEIIQAGSVGAPRFWRFTTTVGGQRFVDVPVETWVTLETFYHPDPDNPSKLSITDRVWNQDHTELLLSVTLQGAEVFLQPNYSELGGPLYSWFTYFEANLARLVVDDTGVGPRIVVPFILGDMDGDGDVDNFDIQPFEMALTDRDGWEATYFLHDADERGDIDGDGDLDSFDITPFEQLVVEGGPLAASAAVPEPSAFFLLGIGIAGLAIGARRRRAG